jgi:TonB family protein
LFRRSNAALKRRSSTGHQKQMAAGAQTEGWSGPSRRRVPRFLVQAQVDLTVLRSGVPDTVPGRSVNVCERGVAAIIAGELVTGESVGVELQLPPLAEPLRTRALVRYQDKLRCGLEFVALSAEQRASIRDWAKEARAIAEETLVSAAANRAEQRENEPTKGSDSRISAKPPSRAKRKRRGWWGLVGLLVLLSAAAICWWRWNRAWDDLEFGLRSAQAGTVEKPRAQVAAEVMQKLLVHRVEPVYPAEARKEGLEGTIALDIVVGRDGAVLRMHALNGPDVLARAAMDALRWWKFEPYRINGEAAVVETTVAVEFKR